MNDYTMKAILYAVSLFVTMVTLTLLITYYNTSKLISDAANNRTDIAGMMEEIVSGQEVFNEELSGTEIRSLIRKYAGDEKVEINIISISGLGVVDYDNVNNLWFDENDRMIKESMLSIVNPVWNNKVEKTTSGEKVILTVELDV